MLPKNQNGTTGEVMAKNQTLIIVESPAKAETGRHIWVRTTKLNPLRDILEIYPKVNLE
jgi:hypothetical protein